VRQVDLRFLALFALTTALIVLAAAAGGAAASGGGIVPGLALAGLGVAAVLGLAALVRIAYLDGRAAAGRRAGRQS